MKRIALTQGKYALVDNEDFEWLNQWKWWIRTGKWGMYVYRQKVISKKTYSFYMHREILKHHKVNIEDLYVDHKNNNGLDNQKKNLRPVTNSQNQMNRKIQTATNKTGYKGISWDKKNKKWKARIMINKREIFLGRFNTVEDGAVAYNLAAKQYFKEYANFNQI